MFTLWREGDALLKLKITLQPLLLSIVSSLDILTGRIRLLSHERSCLRDEPELIDDTYDATRKYRPLIILSVIYILKFLFLDLYTMKWIATTWINIFILKRGSSLLHKSLSLLRTFWFVHRNQKIHLESYCCRQ